MWSCVVVVDWSRAALLQVGLELGQLSALALDAHASTRVQGGDIQSIRGIEGRKARQKLRWGTGSVAGQQACSGAWRNGTFSTTPPLPGYAIGCSACCLLGSLNCASAAEVKIAIEGMMCDGCSGRIEKVLKVGAISVMRNARRRASGWEFGSDSCQQVTASNALRMLLALMVMQSCTHMEVVHPYVVVH